MAAWLPQSLLPILGHLSMEEDSIYWEAGHKNEQRLDTETIEIGVGFVNKGTKHTELMLFCHLAPTLIQEEFFLVWKGWAGGSWLPIFTPWTWEAFFGGVLHNQTGDLLDYQTTVLPWQESSAQVVSFPTQASAAQSILIPKPLGIHKATPRKIHQLCQVNKKGGLAQPPMTKRRTWVAHPK